MAVKRAQAKMDVVEAARLRVKNVFSNGVPVYMSFSGGKDSICMADVVYKLIERGEIDAKQLTVIFIDEEAIYDCVIEMTKTWRKKFMLAGAQFRWYCLPVKQVSCMNHLTNDESWITWEPGKEDVWVIRRYARVQERQRAESRNAANVNLFFFPAAGRMLS